MKVLKKAFPEWDGHMIKYTYDKFKNIFDENDMVTVERRLEELRSAAPLPRVTSINRSLTMRNIESLEARLSLEQRFLAFDIIHTVGLVFSMFELPFVVGFDLDPSPVLLTIDGLLVLEGIVFVALSFVIYKR
jgi:hypothetical protein